MKRPLRIGYGRLFHEANAYSPVPTTLADFERMHLVGGDALERATTLRGVELKSFMPHAELTGFRQAARLAGGVTCVPLESALAVPSGPLARESFDRLVDRLLERIERALPLDGVYLALHGSMQVEGLDEAPEAHLLRAVRARLDSEAQIAVSFDLHANLSEGLVAPVSVLVAYRTNPHWDLAPTGFRAGRRLIRALRGEIRPVHAWRKLPMVLGGGMTIDWLPPMRGVFRAMKRLEADPRVVSASLFMVHPFTSAEHLGWAVHVSTDADRELADRLADDLADRAWAMREIPLPSFYGPAEAIDEVRRSVWRKLGPVTLIDADDIVGAGAPGGNTHIVRALVDAGGDGLAGFVPVHDPALVDELWSVPAGTRRHVILRGTPGYGMPEVPLEATVNGRANSDYGRLVRLDVDAHRIVVSDRGPLPIHPSFWEAVGLSIRDADLVVQKNFFHYRMFHLTSSFRHLPVVSVPFAPTAAVGATSLGRVRDQAYPIPMAPRAKLTDWRPHDPVLRAPRSQMAADAEQGGRGSSLGASSERA